MPIHSTAIVDPTALVITRGAEGSYIYADGQRLDIPSVKAEQVVDPTGCGDAYRAGLLFGIVNQLDWEDVGRLAGIMGALKIAHSGAQNHRLTRDEIGELYAKHFGFSLW